MVEIAKLKMPALMGSGFFLSSKDVGVLVSEMAQGLCGLSNSPEKPLGLAADLSPIGIMLVFSAIALGRPVAMIPVGEPAASVDAWLAQLGVEQVVYATAAPHILALKTKKELASDVQKLGKKAACANFRPASFSSIIRTSGSTAEPKSAMVSFAAHMASAQSVTEYFAITAGSCFGLNLPLSHVSGLSILFRSLTSGCSLYLAQDRKELSVGLSAQKISHLSLVPAQLAKLLEQSVELNSLKALIIGGDALSEKLAQAALAQKIALFSTYGLTETASMVYVYDHKTLRGTVLPHAKLAIAPDGEIEVGGASLFEGYFLATGQPKQKLFKTKDLGSLDAKDVLRICGRKDNQIICGGENVLPEEIEEVLCNHPQIEQCVVIGISDETFGLRLKAFLRSSGPSLRDEALVTYLATRLPRFKIPKIFMTWPPEAPLIQKKARSWFQAHGGS